MTAPRLIKEAERDDASWRRTVRDAINLLIRRNGQGGSTSQRPHNPDAYTSFYDTTLKKPVWYDGATWRDAAGTAV